MKKAQNLNDYFPESMKRTTPRIEAYSDNQTARKLLLLHTQNGAVELALTECVSENESCFPMPDKILSILDQRIQTIDNPVIVTGIDAYLFLLREVDVRRFQDALRSQMDCSKRNIIYLLSSFRLDQELFINPKYDDSVVLLAETQPPMEPAVSVTVVAEKWFQKDNNPTNWKALLKKLGSFLPTDDCTLVLEKYTEKIAGLGDHISQRFRLEEIAKQYYGIEDHLPYTVLEILIGMCKEEHTDKPSNVLQRRFGQKNLDLRFGVKRLLELQNEELWPAYVWYLKKNIDASSYLTRVLEGEIEKDNLLRTYVSTMASTLLSDPNAKFYADERRNAIKEIGTLANAQIIDFITNIKEIPDDTVVPWLNCQTEAERIEIIRRVSQCDLTIGLPNIWRNQYPSFEDYLSDQYDYGDSDLTEYFRDYRRLKIANRVTETFVQKAFEAVVPKSVPLRDSVLQKFSSDDLTTLLVVDGMGAEYYPLLLAMAKRRNMSINFKTVASVRLPSSTEFNKIQWDAARCLKPLHRLDVISHEGAKKYEHSTPQQNTVAVLDEFEDIFNRIIAAFADYDRVVVTGDHGCSRLAVLAHGSKMVRTLKWNGDPEDWRYAQAPPNVKRPDEFEAFFDAERNATFWVVRGYHRLPKNGGKLCVHGGATLEERLVPVIVFSKQKVATVQQTTVKPVMEQFIEKEGFDDI